MTVEMILLILALIIIAVLAAIAAVLLYKVSQNNKAQRAQLAEKEASLQVQRERVNSSIQILAQAVGRDELTLTEASIRISFLLDSLGVAGDVREEFSAFYQLMEQTRHIPILENWKKLGPKEQKEFDRQRLKLEADYREFVLDAAARIQGRKF